MSARRISINGRFLGRPISGVERYGREMIRAWDALLAATPDAPTVRIVAPPGVTCDLPLTAITFETVGRRGGHLWEQVELFGATRRHVLVGLANSGPVLHPRQLVVIHDAAVYRFPDAYGFQYRTLHRTLGRLLARRARLATVSEFSRGELAETLGIAPGTILVAPNGSDHLGRAVPDPAIVARLDLADTPFLLSVGTASRNKNLQLVLDAWRRLGAGGRARLVVAGPVNDRIFAATLRTERLEGAIFPGRVSDAELAALYRAAAAFVFPSRYEGFGIPPLEAMAHGCPVLAASIPPLREVCGGAARYFDPDDAAGLAALMAEALATPRAAGVSPGAAERLARYRWADGAAILGGAATALARSGRG